MTSLTERDIHQAIVDWLHVALPDGSVFHHSPNEGRHKVQYRVMQKRLGVRAGWPDIEIFTNRTWWREDTGLHWAPIFLEIKTDKGRLSDIRSSHPKTMKTIDAEPCSRVAPQAFWTTVAHIPTFLWHQH